jgi:hypothetical protein
VQYALLAKPWTNIMSTIADLEFSGSYSFVNPRFGTSLIGNGTRGGVFAEIGTACAEAGNGSEGLNTDAGRTTVFDNIGTEDSLSLAKGKARDGLHSASSSLSRFLLPYRRENSL